MHLTDSAFTDFDSHATRATTNAKLWDRYDVRPTAAVEVSEVRLRPPPSTRPSLALEKAGLLESEQALARARAFSQFSPALFRSLARYAFLPIGETLAGSSEPVRP